VSFLGHVEFCRRFIKDNSKIVSPLCSLLVKNPLFDFNEAHKRAFDELKLQLIANLTVQPPN